MCVNNLPKVATQWNSGTTRDSNRGRRVLIPSALTTTQPSNTVILRTQLNPYGEMSVPQTRREENNQTERERERERETETETEQETYLV